MRNVARAVVVCGSWMVVAGALMVPAAWGHWFETVTAQEEAGPGTTPTHRFEEVASGVYFATGTGSVFVQSNSMVVVNESDVLVVDSHVTPAAAEALLAAIKTLTDKPVRTLVNTHYHFDHAHGNQVFRDRGIDIVGHEYTRSRLLGDVLHQRTFVAFTSSLPQRIAEMKKNLAGAPEDQKAALREQIRVQENHLEALAETRPTPPNVTLARKMTLYRGSREIQLHFLGRGHTGGDVVVYLPGERLVFTGDLLLPFPSYMGDGFADEWVQTLEALKALDFDTVLPGHGAIFRGKEKIEHFQAYLEDVWGQVKSHRAQGHSAAETTERIDLSGHRDHYPMIPEGIGANLLAISRIYQLLDAR